MIRHGISMFLFALAILAFAVSCAGPTPTPVALATPAPRLQNTPFVANTPVGVSRAATPEATPERVAARPGAVRVDMDAIAPPGRGRDLVMMNCSNCHSPFCAFRNQRTLGHWELVQEQHDQMGWVNRAAPANMLIYDYLEKNFNDSKPEPVMPDVLASQAASGCTTPALR